LEAKNRKEIERELKSGNIDWDAVVKVSTAHYVFPALYCNLNRAAFLHYLPEELVNYMIYKSMLNREHRKWLILRTTYNDLHKEKLVQLGFKKT